MPNPLIGLDSTDSAPDLSGSIVRQDPSPSPSRNWYYGSHAADDDTAAQLTLADFRVIVSHRSFRPKRYNRRTRNSAKRPTHSEIWRNGCRTNYGRNVRIARRRLAVNSANRSSAVTTARRDSRRLARALNSSRRPTICEYSGFLIFSQDVLRRSV